MSLFDDEFYVEIIRIILLKGSVNDIIMNSLYYYILNSDLGDKTKNSGKLKLLKTIVPNDSKISINDVPSL